MRKLLLSFFVIIMALATVSCQNSSLNGKSFKIVELNGIEYVPVGEGVVPMISFSSSQANANLGGNSIFVPYSVSKSGTITISEGGMTRMMVPEEYREDEFVTSLHSVCSFSLEGNILSLYNADKVLVIKGVLVQ